MAYMRLGDLLVSSGVITNEQLEKALGMQKETKERLGDVLIRAGFITEQQLIEALEMQLGVEFVDLTAVSIPVELASYVPKNIAKKFCVVPVKLVKDTLYLAMSDPLDFVAQEEVKVASRKRVIPMIATRRTTEHAISLLYGSEGTARVIEEMKREAGSSTLDIVPVQLSQETMDSSDSAPTIRFVNSLIERAFSERASDIHLEPQDGEMVVRMRIDGLLRRVLTVPSELQSTVISRLKIMGGMNIAEHKIPQDGQSLRADQGLHARPSYFVDTDGVRRKDRAATSRQVRAGHEQGGHRPRGRGLGALSRAAQEYERRHPACRPDGQRQIDHDVRDAPGPRARGNQYRHARGPCRVPHPRREPVPDQRKDRHDVCKRPARDFASGPRYHFRRRNSRRRDREHRDALGHHGTPGAFDPAPWPQAFP